MRRSARRSGSGARSRVALLIETSLASGRDILRGISSFVRSHEPWALIHEAHGLEEGVPGWLQSWKGDGVIARIQSREMADTLLATGIPVVDVLGVVPDLPFPLVHTDNGAIGRMAAEHLIGRGVKHFAFLGIEGENWSDERFEGFGTALASYAAAVHKFCAPRDSTTRASLEYAERDLTSWVAGLPRPVGVLVCSDQRGPALLEACRRAELRVPDDVAVIGVDDDDALCQVCDPPLSSVRAGHARVGYEAAAALDRILRGDVGAKSPALIAPENVIARRSTDVLSVDDPTLAAALRLIRERSHEELHVGAIAQHMKVSRSALQRSFRTTLRRSVHQEIVATRINRARELLLETDLPLATVAERAGFKHQEYMGVVFKARLGTTPAQLRRGSTLGR